MSTYSTQGSISIKRLRTGDNLFISFITNGKPLYQGVNPENDYAVTPDFTNVDNQIIITPSVVSSLSNQSVALKSHEWYYIGIKINITNGEDIGDGFYKEVTSDGSAKFAINPSTGALKIIGNLATKENVGNDVLTYKGIASVLGVEYNVTKDLEFMIQTLSSSAYQGLVTLASGQDAILESDTDSITINTSLLMGGTGQVSGYSVNWYKDNDTNVWKTGTSISVTRADVNYMQLFRAEFLVNNTVVSRAGIIITDKSDEYRIVFTQTGDMVSDTQSVIVTAKIQNVSTGAEYTPTGATWTMSLYDALTLSEELKKESGNTITVTTEHTDVTEGGVLVRFRDIVVLAEVSWN